MLRTLTFLAAALALVPAAASATPIVDVDLSHTPSGYVGSDLYSEYCQVFTVGVAGRLSSIAAAGWEYGPAPGSPPAGPAIVNVVEILPDGTPDTSHFLGQARFSSPPSGVDEFDMTNRNIMVEPGEKLGLLVYRSRTGMTLFGSSDPAPPGVYGLGRINVTGGLVGPWQPSGNMLFVTKVEPLPEPATLALLAVGVLCLVAASRRNSTTAT